MILANTGKSTTMTTPQPLSATDTATLLLLTVVIIDST
jgi:hypothetical protein